MHISVLKVQLTSPLSKPGFGTLGRYSPKSQSCCSGVLHPTQLPQTDVALMLFGMYFPFLLPPERMSETSV